MSLWSYIGDAVKAINPINIVSDIGSSILGYNMNAHSQNKLYLISFLYQTTTFVNL